MTTEEIRQRFERVFPPPIGVKWDGDHYVGCKEVIGSYRNATIWADRFCGYRAAKQEVVQ